MLFNSVTFFIFFTIFLIVWPWFKKNNQCRWGCLVVSSFIFYGWWDWRFLTLIIISGMIDYVASLLMVYKPALKGKFLALSLLGNLGMLFIFKYSSFVASNIDALLSSFNINSALESNIPEFCLILPVGISFYTFQSLSYTIDVYRGKIAPTTNPMCFFAYLAMFPQLVAGPIVRASDLLVQLKTNVPINNAMLWLGTRRIIYGFFKKVIIADNIAKTVDYAFANHLIYDQSTYWWMIIVAFGVQIYCDFSGYSDIAIGVAYWMGFTFPENFNYPYLSRSLREFWQRWHISLSTWFRDYVYIPLGGNKDDALRVNGRICITMLLCGFWHGASWNFIIWGGLHAMFIIIEKLFKLPKRLSTVPLGNVLLWFITMMQVMVAWVFFRADSFSQGTTIIANMFSFTGAIVPVASVACLLYLAIFIIFELSIIINVGSMLSRFGKIKHCIDVLFWATLAIVCIFFRGPSQQFIYFQF